MTTYVATAPDGSQHTRKTDRTYTHAVLLEGKEGWGAVGFCGHPDLAEKKRGEHPGSIVVECGVLGDRAADMPDSKATEPAAPDADDTPEREQTVDEKIAAATVRGPEPKQTIGSMVQEMLMDPDLGYQEIVDQVLTEFPEAKTSTRSVASVAAALRRNGSDVPTRRKAKG